MRRQRRQETVALQKDEILTHEEPLQTIPPNPHLIRRNQPQQGTPKTNPHLRPTQRAKGQVPRCKVLLRIRRRHPAHPASVGQLGEIARGKCVYSVLSQGLRLPALEIAKGQQDSGGGFALNQLVCHQEGDTV